MSKRQWIILLGVVIIVLPFLGFPSGWDTIISVCAGLIIIAVAYTLAPRQYPKSADQHLPYAEHKNQAPVQPVTLQTPGVSSEPSADNQPPSFQDQNSISNISSQK